jgi:hypothetical protein
MRKHCLHHTCVPITEAVMDRIYAGLRLVYGNSAATTYCWLRQQGEQAEFSWKVMLDQVKTLGPTYGGGFDCVPFRRMREADRL